MRTLSLVVLLMLGASVASGQEAAPPAFADFLAGVREEALARGIRKDVLDEALANIDEPVPVVLDRDRTQAEIVLPLETYINQRMKPAAIRTGQDMVARHGTLLADITKRYGVPGPILVAIWGIESNFGQFSGTRPTVAALATLAWDPRRATFFRGELFKALEILNRGDIEAAKMRGSWAGAMGQPQFIPSSYLEYAEDYDHDGRRDIWTSVPDVLASIANYLKGHGWAEGEGWGREVSVSPDTASRIAATVERRQGTCQATRDMTAARTLAEWTMLGVTSVDGTPLPPAAASAALVSGASRHFLVSANYDALLAYNCAHAYAVSVGLLADRMAPASAPQPEAPKKAAKPKKKKPAKKK